MIRDSYLFIVSIALLLSSCENNQIDNYIFLGQGTMTGEVTENSAILQTRLTATDTIYQKDLSGKAGWVRFTWAHDKDFDNTPRTSRWMKALEENDFIVKTKITDLEPDKTIYYQVHYGEDSINFSKSNIARFRTNPGREKKSPVSFVVVTGMNYYFHFYGNYDAKNKYLGKDRDLGFPALKTIGDLSPDYFIGTGDNVYFDHPAAHNYKRAIDRGSNPLPGLFDGKEVLDEQGMRRKYHVQFAQPRFRSLFGEVATYWEKDDHDYRVNDSDPYNDFPISHELGVKNFREQLPMVDPEDKNAVTYRTIRLNHDVQLWFLEGRDYRSANKSPDGPDKTIWGKTQRDWLKNTLLDSDANYKCIISPTPMVGPDDASKSDNHVNHKGFRTEGDRFFNWLADNHFSREELFFICGDRHWQYHAKHPSGYEEFSCGALVDANSRAGRLAGDPKSTDPDGEIIQYYVQGQPDQATGGFLLVNISYQDTQPELQFRFYDDVGNVNYSVVR